MTDKSYAVILCGGSGTRMGTAGNKTLIPLRGTPAIVRVCRAFEGTVDGTVLVVRSGEETLFRDTLAVHGLAPMRIVPGGRSRQESVRCGLDALPDDAGTVLIHDGARPLVSNQIIRRVLDGVAAYGSAVAAVPARDTIKKADAEGRVTETLNRSELWQMQTPQGFRAQDLRRAHELAKQDYTDDAALMEAAGYPVRLVQGGFDNIKLTSKEDVRLAEGLLGGMPEMRVGHGFDAHRLTEGRELWLCGVRIPYEKGLLGHSDADVAVHALMDAMLGAAAMPDIGHLFPDNDPQYEGISSMLLLRRVSEKLAAGGWQLCNADITIVAQRPRLASYIDAMRQAVADELRVPVSRIGVKASTTEHMGYEGRGEGITTYASVLLTGTADTVE